MKCPNCGNELPADSEFCQYCGKKLSTETEQLPSQENSPILDATRTLSQKPRESTFSSKKSKYCKYCGGIIDEETRKCSSCGKQYFKFPKKAVGITALIIVFVILAGSNVYQYFFNGSTISNLEYKIKERDELVSSLKQQLKDKNSAITTQKTTLETQKSKIAELENKADYYDKICDFLASDNAGYASNNFKASESIIILKRSSSRKSFTLTADFNSDVNIFINTNGQSASVDFADSTFYGSTTAIYVTPITEGITVATFSNDSNSQTFRVLIIVTAF